MADSDFRYDFFISYDRNSSGDFAKKLCSNLVDTYKANVFIDDEMDLGAKWELEIRQAIEHSRVVVVVLPPEPSTSPYMTSEVHIAIDLARLDAGRKVVWVYIGEHAPNLSQLILGLQELQGFIAAEYGGVKGVAERLWSDYKAILHDTNTISKRTGVRLFPSRDHATPGMLDDTANATRAYFFGISNRKLWSYLQQVANSINQHSLPLEHVEVYFANNELGNLLEPNKFSSNVQEALLRIGIVLKSYPGFADPRVEFYQVPHILGPSGSRFLLVKDTQNNNLPFSVIYNVFVERGVDLSVAWTMSMHYSQCDPKERQRTGQAAP